MAADKRKADEIIGKIYEQLRKLAERSLASETPGQTLSATALVHETYHRLVDKGDKPIWDNSGHFYAAAAIAMRRILIDSARRKKAVRHGGDRQRVDFNSRILFNDSAPDRLPKFLDFEAALSQFEAEYPIKSELVKLRVFSGMTMAEAAEYLNISLRTAQRYWSFSKAWLFERLQN